MADDIETVSKKLHVISEGLARAEGTEAAIVITFDANGLHYSICGSVDPLSVAYSFGIILQEIGRLAQQAAGVPTTIQ